MFIQALMQQIRSTLHSHFFVLQHQEKCGEIKACVLSKLPKDLEYLLDNIVSQEMAQARWHLQTKMSVNKVIQFAYNYLKDPSNEWSISIGHVIPCDPYGESFGDASTFGGGFYLLSLKFWSVLVWSPDTHRHLVLERHSAQLHEWLLPSSNWLLLLQLCLTLSLYLRTFGTCGQMPPLRPFGNFGLTTNCPNSELTKS